MVSKIFSGLNKTALAFKNAYANKRVAIMAPLGFSSGLPLALTGSTLSAWMATEKIDLTTIGLFGLVNLPLNLKVLWAPLFDRFNLPWLSRRRDWMIVSQLALLCATFLLGNFDPTTDLSKISLLAFLIAILTTSQDIVVDAYRVDVLKNEERASGLAIFVAIYRVATIVSSAGALLLSEIMPWQTVYKLLSGLMAVGIVATIAAPRIDSAPSDTPRSLRDALVLPWIDFFKRPGALVLLAIIMTYKVGDWVASVMLMPFLIGLGFSPGEIGAVYKMLGLWLTIVGSLAGGGLILRIGIKKSLILFGILQAGANALYIALAWAGKNHIIFILSISVDHLFNGLGTAAFGAFLMSLCNRRFSATQYALFSGAGTIVGRLIGGTSGMMAKAFGWPVFFALTFVAAVPALALLGKIKTTMSLDEKRSD